MHSLRKNNSSKGCMFKIKSGQQTPHGGWQPACPLLRRTGEVGTFLLVTGQPTRNSAISRCFHSHSDKNQWCNCFVLKAVEWRKIDFVTGRKKKTHKQNTYFANTLFLCLFISLSQGTAPRRSSKLPHGHPHFTTTTSSGPHAAATKLALRVVNLSLLASPVQWSNEEVSRSPVVLTF